MPVEYLDVGGIVVTLDSLVILRARETASLLQRHVLDYATLIECRRRYEGREEIVVIEVEVQTPQVKAHDIRSSERVALVFRKDDGRPDVLSMRPDFPQVPHINLMLTEYPKSLCLYEEDWSELKSRWTPARFVERVRYWFAETVRGSLHQEDQPLEPLLAGSGYQLVVPPDVFTTKAADDVQRLVVTMPGGEKSRVLLARRPDGSAMQGAPFVAVALQANPMTHGVIRNAPASLHELHQFLTAAGLDLLGKLRSSQALWADTPNLKAKLIIVVACPKTRGTKTIVESIDVWSFMTLRNVAEILAAIGRRAAGGGLLLGEPSEHEQGQLMSLEVLRTVYAFSPATAAYLNGLEQEYRPNIVAVGLGALGSKVHLGLARSGFGNWTLIDDDVLLPHNLARHQYTGFSIGLNKAFIAAMESQSLFEGEAPPVSIPANVLSAGEHEAALKKAFLEAEVLLDLSASVSVARHLSLTVDSKARRVSVFLNPSGTDLVILAEDKERKTSLDALEFQFYRGVLSDKRLAKHLTESTGRVRYSASCRDITSRVPDAQVSMLAAIAVRAIPKVLENDAAQIKVWQLDAQSFEVSSFTVPAKGARTQELSGWTLVVDRGLESRLQTLRKSKLPNETGGVLLGHFDHTHHRVYVTETIPSPPDSQEWPTLYIRGSAMLAQEIERVNAATGANLEYIGEWHSHPKGCSCQPSQDDIKVFAWLTTHMDEEGLPALMSIVGDRGPVFFLGQLIWNGG